MKDSRGRGGEESVDGPAFFISTVDGQNFMSGGAEFLAWACGAAALGSLHIFCFFFFGGGRNRDRDARATVSPQ